MTEGEDFFANLVIEHDPEPMPQLVGGGRAAIEIPEHVRQAIRQSYYTLLQDGKGAEAVQRIMVPVKAAECDWKDQTVTRKDKNGAVIETTVTKWQQHPLVTRTVTVLRRAAEKEGLGVRIVVDRKTGDDGSQAFAIKSGAVRVRFIGTKRKERTKTRKATESV